MYEVHVLAIYHVANAEIEFFFGGGEKQCWEQVVFIVNTISKKKCAIPVEFLYITVQVC